MATNISSITETDWQYLQTKANLTDQEIKEYRKTPEKLKDLAKDLQKDQGDIRDGLEKAIVAAFPEINSLDDLTAKGNETIKALVEKLLDLSGLELKDKEGKLSIDQVEDNRTAYEILTDTASGNVGVDKEAQIYKNRLASLALNNDTEEDFIKALNADKELSEYIKSDKGAKLLGGEFDDIFYNAQNGWSYNQIKNALIQNTSYAPLYRDKTFDNNLALVQQYLPGFGYAENPEWSNSQIENFKEMFISPENSGIADMFESVSGGTDFLKLAADNTTDFAKAMKSLNAEFVAKKISNYHQFGDDTDFISSSVRDLNKNARTAANAIGSLISKSAKLNDQAVAAQKARGKKGSQLDSKTRGIMSQTMGIDESMIKKMTADEIDKLSKYMEDAAAEEFKSTIGNTLGQELINSIEQSLDGKTITLDNFIQFDLNGDGQIDMSELEQAATALQNEALATLASYAGKIADLNLKYTETGDGISVEAILNSFKSKKYSGGGGGGGGGGGKSAAQKLLERLKREQALLNHEIKMIQYQETKYENASEIGNQNRMIELENEAQKRLIATLEKHIETTRKQMSKTKKNSDDWKSLYDSVLAYEEAIEEANIAIQENTKKIEENEQAILKLHTDLEQEVNTEIENRIQRERDMLAGMVSVQDIILEAIRARYRAEWELIEKDIEKKRAALEEEKNLIDERLQRRKDAEDEAEKYEELAEYKKQLALIEMDSTRTKDAAKLREQIAKLEKDIAWDVAQDEADYQKEQIDNQLQAYDDFVTYGGEDLEEFLADANNMADEVNGVMQLSQEGILDWLKANVEEYGQAMDAAQKQIIQGWIDTYEQMIGYTHTYWEEIADILSGKNLFLEYMKASQDYINASEDEQAQMLYNWGEMYDNWLAAQKRDAVYSHSDDGLSGLGTNGTKKKSNNNNGNKDPKVDDLVTDTKETVLNVYIDNNGYSDKKEGNDAPRVTYAKAVFNESQYARYASGGLVDYTGPAWVDGSPMKPEAFLDADDTALIRSFLDEAKVVRYRSSISNIDSNSFGSNAQNIGELVINITEAQFKDDADFDEVAHRVGEKFVKELSKQGFNTMSYSF